MAVVMVSFVNVFEGVSFSEACLETTIREKSAEVT